ncbi:hypothetical protein [Pseudomonas sp. A34-9]|uniref:hypothetical protein n=1 Tax=Pseudomonas sp. A34-9 TaxID=3034675 RepID=UPI00240CE534|nr:hypothetical protein [Pseudomonas sp. A34-9]
MSDPLPAKPAEKSVDLAFLARKPTFLECDDAAAFLHGMKFEENTEVLWFILKNSQGRYVCAEFLKSDAPEVSNDSDPLEDPLFVSKCARGQLCVPVGYTVVASFHLHPRAKPGPTETSAEFSYRNRFFSWSDLWAVMNRRRQYSRCYLSTGEDGLISYTSNASDFEADLARQIAKNTDKSAGLIQRLYEGGTFPASIWILLAIGAGELQVVVNCVAKSALWFRRGALNANWKWYVDPNNRKKKRSIELMPIFSPVFHDIAGVASYWRIRQPNSSEGQTVGVILKHNHRDEFIATAAHFSDYVTFDLPMLFPKDRHGNLQFPEGFRVYGFYHSSKPSLPDLLPAADTERFKNFFSPADMKVGLDRLVAAPHHHLFMITPDEAVLSFSQPGIPVRALIVELTTDFERKLVSGETTTQMYVDKVAAAGNLSVLSPSKTWPTVGRVRPSAELIARIPEPAE